MVKLIGFFFREKKSAFYFFFKILVMCKIMEGAKLTWQALKKVKKKKCQTKVRDWFYSIYIN